MHSSHEASYEIKQGYWQECWQNYLLSPTKKTKLSFLQNICSKDVVHTEFCLYVSAWGWFPKKQKTKKNLPAFPVTSRLIKAALVPDWSPLIATIAEILPVEGEAGHLRRVEPDFSVGPPGSSSGIVLHIIFHIHCRKTAMLCKLFLKYHQLNLSMNRNHGRTKGTCAGQT